MFKLLKGEIKKLLLKPSLFILILILGIVIGFSYSMFQPEIRVDNRATFASEKNSTIQSVYDKFMTGGINQTFSKDSSLAQLNNANDLINTYSDYIITYQDKDVITLLNELKVDVESTLNNFYAKKTSIFSSDVSTINCKEIGDIVGELKTKSNVLYEKFYEITSKANPIVLVSLSEMEEILNNLQAAKNLFSRLNDDVAPYAYNNTNNSYVKELVNKFFKVDCLSYFNCLADGIYEYSSTPVFNNLISVKLTSDFITDLKQNYLAVAENRTDKIANDIEEFKTTNIAEHNLEEKYINEINLLVSKYYATCKQMYDILVNKITLEISKDYREEKFVTFYSFEKFDRYNLKEVIVAQEALFANNKADFEYANVLSTSTTSNFDINAYDFAFYILNLFSFVLIIYAILMASSIVATEQNNGTLKLIAIRPYTRGKILASKIFAVLTFIVIFTLFSFILSFIAGYFLFGINSMDMLVIYDGTTAFVSSPLVILFIYTLCLMVKIIAYAMIALALSIVFRNSLISTIISTIFLFVTAIFSSFLGTISIYKYFPFSNFDLFKYFGSGVGTNTGTINAGQFNSQILPDTTFTFSLIIALSTIAIMYIISKVVFEKRDLT